MAGDARALNLVICLLRVPLHKTRSLRRLMSDNGMSLEELRALAENAGAADSSPSPNLPVERLTNFMDVCARTGCASVHCSTAHPLFFFSVSVCWNKFTTLGCYWVPFG